MNASPAAEVRVFRYFMPGLVAGEIGAVGIGLFLVWCALLFRHIEGGPVFRAFILLIGIASLIAATVRAKEPIEFRMERDHVRATYLNGRAHIWATSELRLIPRGIAARYLGFVTVAGPDEKPVFRVFLDLADRRQLLTLLEK